MVESEHIIFELDFFGQYWDQPPLAKISINNDEKYHGSICDIQQIAFSHTLAFNQRHVLKIERFNKTDSQCRINALGQLDDQILHIKKIAIDGINIRNLIWHKSVFTPMYPKLWAAQQKHLGIKLESNIVGETILSHNGSWTFEFSSPFWNFLIYELA